MEELDNIPISFTTLDSFFSTAHNNKFSDASIMSSIFNSAIASSDFIENISEGGLDKTANKIVMCRECNNLRGRNSYNEFIKYHPETPEFMQKQMDMITENILNGKIPKFLRFYPIKASDTIAKKTNGQIKLDIKKYCDEVYEPSKNILKMLNAEIRRLKDLYSQKSQAKIKDKKELQTLSYQILELQDKIGEEEHLQSRIRDYLKG